MIAQQVGQLLATRWGRGVACLGRSSSSAATGPRWSATSDRWRRRTGSRPPAATRPRGPRPAPPGCWACGAGDICGRSEVAASAPGTRYPRCRLARVSGRRPGRFLPAVRACGKFRRRRSGASGGRRRRGAAAAGRPHRPPTRTTARALHNACRSQSCPEPAAK